MMNIVRMTEIVCRQSVVIPIVVLRWGARLIVPGYSARRFASRGLWTAGREVAGVLIIGAGQRLDNYLRGSGIFI
jgi:hypothetical protein